MTILAWCIAWVLDFIIGDPQHWPHPVRWIGRLITFVQRIVRRYCPGDKALRIGGGVMWVVVVGATSCAARARERPASVVKIIQTSTIQPNQG